MLGDFFSECEFLPSPADCVSYSWDHTKGKPIRGKYAKYSEYRFHELKGDPQFQPMKCHTIPDTKKFFHWKASPKPGHLLRRKYPCFCVPCFTGSPSGCQNNSFCGEWEQVAVRSKV